MNGRILASLLAALLLPSRLQALEFDWVLVDDPGNPSDTMVMDDQTTGWGSVPYRFHIAAREVTVGEWVEFLNAVALEGDPHGLRDGRMSILDFSAEGFHRYVAASDPERPVGFVQYWDALRFANWVHNGQPRRPEGPGTTEDGAYTMSGTQSTPARNPDATAFIPSEDEWYKAAYYDPDTGGYFVWPTSSNDPPACEEPPGGPNSANCDRRLTSTSPVGSYAGTSSPSGGWDLAGNVFEWTENGSVRGGAGQAVTQRMHASQRTGYGPSKRSGTVGLRLAGHPTLPCNDGLDNDGNGLTDLEEFGCWASEAPKKKTSCGLVGVEWLTVVGLAHARMRRWRDRSR